MRAVVRVRAAETGRSAEHPDLMAVHGAAILIDTHNDVTDETVKGLDLA